MKKAISVLLGFALAISMNLPATAATYKIAHIFAPSNPINVASEKFAEDVAKESNGNIKFEVLHSGVVGGEVEIISQVMSGSLEFAATGGIGMFQNFSPKAGVEELPFLFANVESAHRAADGEFGKLVAEQIINPLGLVTLGYMENGFRHFTNNKRPIVVPDDMKGIKFRSASSPIRIKMFEALGSQAIPMAFPELFTGLQQGTVDGQENPVVNIYSSKFYEVQKYLSLSGHIYSFGPFIVNQKFWKSLKQEDRDMIQKNLDVAVKYQRQLCRDTEIEMLADMEKKGMAVNKIDTEAFKAKMQPVWDIFIKQHGDELLKAAQKASQ